MALHAGRGKQTIIVMKPDVVYNLMFFIYLEMDPPRAGTYILLQMSEFVFPRSMA
jgi:hypothetical protein